MVPFWAMYVVGIVGLAVGGITAKRLWVNFVIGGAYGCAISLIYIATRISC